MYWTTQDLSNILNGKSDWIKWIGTDKCDNIIIFNTVSYRALRA